MMRRTSGDVKSPTKYVIEAFSSPLPHRRIAPMRFDRASR
jgi:hypothetical protein